MELLKSNFLSGDVYRVSVKELDTFFEDNYPFKISNSGVTSFLKALSIPEKYFLKQPDETRMELLVNQKNSMSQEKDLILLIRNDIVEYVSLSDQSFVTDLIDRTDVSKDWIYLEENLQSGYIRYFMPADPITKKDEYSLGVFIDYPVLFSKPMIINAGFYREESQNDSDTSMELIIPDTKVKLKSINLPETDHNSYFLDMLEAIKKEKLGNIVSFLEGLAIDSQACITLLLSFEKDKLINKTVSKKARKYIEKEELIITDTMELAEVLHSFIYEAKTYASKIKLKTDILFCLLKASNKLPVVSYTQDFNEGY